MARPNRIWWWNSRGEWAVNINGQRHRLGPDREEAERKFHELKAKPQRRPVRSDSVLAIFDAWLEHVKINRAEKTYVWYLDFAQSFIDSIPKGLAVSDLKVHHVQSWVDSHATWSDSTKHGAITTVKRAMRWGEKQGLIDSNPIAFAEKPPITNREVVIPNEHYRYMLENSDPCFRDLITVAWESGPRPQELTTVEKRHVDFARGRWVFYTVESKGKRIRRVVYLTDNSLNITKRLCDQWPEGPIFRNTKGEPWNKTSLNSRFVRMQIRMGRQEMKRRKVDAKPTEVRKLVRALRPTKSDHGAVVKKTKAERLYEARAKLRKKLACSLAPKYCLYHIRHTWTTRKLLTGVDSHVVAKLAGHTDTRMIDKFYSHVAENHRFMLTQANVTLEDASDGA